MDLPPDEPVTTEPTGVDPSGSGPARPFAPQSTLALDHVPPINVEVGSGASGLPAVKREPGPLEAGGLRIVIIAWCFWLLGSWGFSWLADTGLPRVRWMLLSGVLGMMVVWPALRLSQPAHPREPGRGAAQSFLDWLAMIVVFQAVIWSLHLIAGWTMERGYWLDAAIVSWTLLSALIVAWGRMSAQPWVRTAAMALVLGVVLAEPVLGVTGVYRDPVGMRVSPLGTLWALTTLPDRAPLGAWQERIVVVGLAAAAGWGVLAALGWLRRDRRKTDLLLEDDPYGQAVEVIDVAAGQRERSASARMAHPPDPANRGEDDTNPG